MQTEIHGLDEATSKELGQFARDLAQDRASPEETATFFQLLKKRIGPESAKAIALGLKDVATSVIAEVIVKAMTR